MFYMRAKRELAARLFRLFYRRQFGRFGEGTRIISPVAIEGSKRIFLGDHVYVAALGCLAATPLTAAAKCRLEIGDGTQLGRFNHVYATERITIGRHVLTANNVYIADNLHGFRDVTRAIVDQPVQQIGEVVIGDGTWLGHNVCVIGARIGRGCVVGANAVVNRDIPDFCVVVGVPARIIRRYDPERAEWRSTDQSGEFIEIMTTAETIL